MARRVDTGGPGALPTDDLFGLRLYLATGHPEPLPVVVDEASGKWLSTRPYTDAELKAAWRELRDEVLSLCPGERPWAQDIFGPPDD